MSLDHLLSDPTLREYLDSLVAADVQYEIIFLNTGEREVLNPQLLNSLKLGDQNG